MALFHTSRSLWLAQNPSKRWGEIFFLIYSAVWIIFFSSIVIFKLYEGLGDLGFMAIGIAVSFPYFVYPALFPSAVDSGLPFGDRYWLKANIWVAIFSYVGNYFWTHYFYKVLGASYSFPVDIQLNEVPFFLYLVTHGYFMFYLTSSTIILRKFWTTFPFRSSFLRFLSSAILIFVMSVITAFMETYTISEVPYYSHKDKFSMYTVGSVFYGIYFYVAFPMFYRVDEKLGRVWTVWRTVVDALGACMLVTIFLDLWRLAVVHFPALSPMALETYKHSLPFM